jgi:putative transposase
MQDLVERLWRSVKHEDVYLKRYAMMGELRLALPQYLAFYNGERRTSRWATGDRVKSMLAGTAGREDRGRIWRRAGESSRADTGQHCSATSEVMDAAYIHVTTVLTDGSVLRCPRKSGEVRH